MTEEEYLAIQVNIIKLTNEIKGLPLDEFLAAIEHCETIAPLIDPTLYQRANKNLDKIKTRIKALLEARAYLKRWGDE